MSSISLDKNTIPENLSLWIRTVSGAIGILLLSAFVLWNSENKKSSAITQETNTNEMRKLVNLNPDAAEIENIQCLD